jgi:hypothetical protein
VCFHYNAECVCICMPWMFVIPLCAPWGWQLDCRSVCRGSKYTLLIIIVHWLVWLKPTKKNLLNCRNRIRIFARGAVSVLPQFTQSTYKFHRSKGVLFLLKASVVSCFVFHRFLAANSLCVKVPLCATFSSLASSHQPWSFGNSKDNFWWYPTSFYTWATWNRL